MSAFEKFVYNVLQARMERPGLYGAWHIVSILLTVALTVCLVMFFRNAKDRTMRTILFIGWIVMIAFEVAKQLNGAMHYDGYAVTWAYEWRWFPFQFCSTPMYTFPLVFLLKDCKFRRAIMAYVSTFSLFAGIIVMILPTSVFTPYITINIQTMVHHGLQVVFGVYMASYNRHHLNKRFFAWCMLVFAAFASVALILDVTVYPVLIEKGLATDFNMFYISPYVNSDLPVLSAIYPKVSYPVYLIIYIFGFTMVAALVYAVEKGIVALTLRNKNRAKDHSPNQA
jgi:hypothetical protein